MRNNKVDVVNRIRNTPTFLAWVQEVITDINWEKLKNSTALVFTDRSQPANPETHATAYTYIIQHWEQIIIEHSYPIGKAIVFEVELAAISTGIWRATNIPYISCIIIYGNSTSALHLVLDPSPHPAQSQSLLLNQALQD